MHACRPTTYECTHARKCTIHQCRHGVRHWYLPEAFRSPLAIDGSVTTILLKPKSLKAGLEIFHLCPLQNDASARHETQQTGNRPSVCLPCDCKRRLCPRILTDGNFCAGLWASWTQRPSRRRQEHAEVLKSATKFPRPPAVE